MTKRCIIHMYATNAIEKKAQVCSVFTSKTGENNAHTHTHTEVAAQVMEVTIRKQ